MSLVEDQYQKEEVFGHPAGLFTLFFAVMWERFSYYGMRALLVLYLIKGFMAREDSDAYAIYGAYTALVYATPFIGGMLADRLLGARRAVILGGLLMAAGHLTMTIENETTFFLDPWHANRDENRQTRILGVCGMKKSFASSHYFLVRVFT